MTNTPGDGPDPSEEPQGPADQEHDQQPSQEQPAQEAQPGYWEQQARQREQQGGPQPQQGQGPGQGQGQPTVPYPQAYPPPGYPPQGYPPPPGYPAQGPVQYAPDHPRATMSLVLGIIGIVACQVLGPIAWWMGRKTLQEIDASGGRYGGRGAAQAGYVMGVVGTVLLAIGLVVLVVYVVFFVAIIGGSMTTTGIG